MTHGVYVRSDRPIEQIVEVVRRLDLRGNITAFTRCLRCNAQLEWVDKAEVLDELEPLTRRCYHEFRRCPQCRRIYWAGSHYDRLRRLLDDILRAARRRDLSYRRRVSSAQAVEDQGRDGCCNW